jgi:hypothetical protein
LINPIIPEISRKIQHSNSAVDSAHENWKVYESKYTSLLKEQAEKETQFKIMETKVIDLEKENKLLMKVFVAIISIKIFK